MEIYEKIFVKLEEIRMTQAEFSRLTGIPTSTVSDWKKKKINPQADKLLKVSRILGMSLTELLGDSNNEDISIVDYWSEERYLIEMFRNATQVDRERMIRYYELLKICEAINNKNRRIKRNVSIIQDVDGNNIVVINDIIFKGKKNIQWKDVKKYLKKYVGEFYTIATTGDTVYIGADLPNEYSGSNYTYGLRGNSAKAKANASQGIPEMIEIAAGKQFSKNQEAKHNRNAKHGWYRYNTRFALPVYDENDELVRYNIYQANLIVRHSEDEKLYLYDILGIKKETSNPIEP